MQPGIIALLDGLGGPEVFFIAVIALLLFGAKRMPEIGRGIGRAIREFKRATSGVEENIREVLYDEPARPKLRPPAQRRPYRDTTAHATPATTAPAATPAPRASDNLNEPAPLESDTSSDSNTAPTPVDSPRTDDGSTARS